MTSLRNSVLGGAMASAMLLAASPATAADYLFDQTNDSFTLAFDGFGGDPIVGIPGLTSELVLTLTGGLGTTSLNFSYELRNTSTSGGLGSRVTGFAFDATPNVHSSTGDGTPTGDFSNINVNGNYPNAIGNVEVCLTGNNGNSCAGGANGGALLGDPANGTFSLIFGSATSQVTLSDFYVRYQSLTGLGNITSASGKEVLIPDPRGAVPEPATWAMLLAGFGAIGASLRTRRASRSGDRVRVRLA